LKYKVVTELDDDRILSFTNVYRHCKDEDSLLWEVIQGQPEWTAMLTIAQKANATDMWLNAVVIGDCPGVNLSRLVFYNDAIWQNTRNLGYYFISLCILIVI
jgi:hypothetical protein